VQDEQIGKMNRKKEFKNSQVVLRSRLTKHEPLATCLLDKLELLEHLLLATADLHAHSHGVRCRGWLDGLLEVLQPLLKPTMRVWGVKHIAGGQQRGL